MKNKYDKIHRKGKKYERKIKIDRAKKSKEKKSKTKNSKV